MDRHDLDILEMLARNSRASLTEISRRIRLSRSAVRDRVEKLFNAGVILGPTIVVDPAQVSMNRTVFFEFKTNPHEPWLAKMLEKTSSCDLLDGTVGEFSLLARFRLTDDEHFAAVLKKIDDAMGRSYFKKYRVVNAIRIFKESGVAFQTDTRGPLKVDEEDRKILRILLNQAETSDSPLPLSTVELSKRLGSLGAHMSQPAVFNRLRVWNAAGSFLDMW
jgi:Lrp/AsnC family leucine-responsive transcriptional regulator